MQAEKNAYNGQRKGTETKACQTQPDKNEN